MEFGRHIGKGLWGLAGRALPSLYGVGIILFVIRVFPPVEFGVYTLLQTIFLLVVSSGQSFALQPLVKFAAGPGDLSGVVTASAVLYAAFLGPVVVLLVALGGPLGSLFNSDAAGGLMWYVCLMLVASFPRNIASYLLQARLELRKLFILDAIYSIGSLALIAFLVPTGRLRTAAGLMQVNMLMLLLSSVYGVAILAGTYALRIVPSAREMRQAWEYGRYSLGASISYTLFSQSDNLLIAALLGAVPLAVYNAAKVFARAFDMALQLMTTLLVPTVAKLESEGRAQDRLPLAEKSFLFSTIALAGLSVVVAVAGTILINLLYGDKYPGATGVLYFLALSGIFIPAISIGSSFCFGMGKMREVFRINLAGSAIGIALMAVGTAVLGIRGTALALVASLVVMAAMWVATLRTTAGVPVTVGGVLSRRSDIINYLRRAVSGRRAYNRT
jgi:O-antigen/teichoic acid export membrane protein